MSQIFKKDIPSSILFDYLNLNCKKNNHYYEFNNYSYKKSIINGELDKFLNSIIEYYHNSKKKYVTRDKSYKNILTILRQICKANHISFCTNIKYIKNSYEIIYKLYY